MGMQDVCRRSGDTGDSSRSVQMTRPSTLMTSISEHLEHSHVTNQFMDE